MDKDFEIETFKILDQECIRLKDKDGEYWYPLTSFFKSFFFRRVAVTTYRENPEYYQHMKVFKYRHPKSATQTEERTWCINTEGIYKILRDTSLRWKKNVSKIIMMNRSKYLAACRNFFGVTKTDDNPLFIGFAPDISNYDVWSIYCITYDRDPRKNDIWRKCDKCGFYYPYTKKYFFKDMCKQCNGSDFKCDNKRIQRMKDTDGYELLYQLYMMNGDKVINELRAWLDRGGITDEIKSS